MKRFLLIFSFLITACLSAHSQAALTDMKFGSSQIADSQWNVNACLNTTTCQIYSKNPGTAYKIPWTNGKLSWAAGDYVKFALSGNSSFPYTATQYNANGTVKAVMGGGKIVNMGPDYFFFVGTDNNTGQLFSGSSGMNSTAGVTWTGTLNPTIAQADAYAGANYSTTPLAAGQTAQPSAPPPPADPTVEGGTITQTNAPTNQTITSGGSSTAGISASQQTRINTWKNSSQQYNNELYIDQVYGYNNNVTITQSGTKNRIEFTLNGNNNVINSTQTGSNYLKEEVPGWGNMITTTQTNTSGQSNYAETKIQGNGNTVNHQQIGTGSHVLFSNINGAINTVSSTQSGNAGHSLDVKLTGDRNNVISDQSGNTQNKANIDLTNAGGSATVDLQQTGGKNFTIIQSCANPAGCNTTVRQ